MTVYQGKSYCIIAESKSLTAYARQKLVFEISKAPNACREEMAAFKKDLIAALGSLKASEDEMLYASYGTTQQTGFKTDLENALFYNIGPAIFRPLTQKGFCFKALSAKEMMQLQARDSIPKDLCYCWSYRLAEPENDSWRGAELVSWQPLPIFPLQGCPAFQYWEWIKRSAGKFHFTGERTEGAFSVQLLMYLPRDAQINPAAAVKPMLDGILSAFHSAAESMEIDALSEELSCPAAWLENREMALLGPHRYVFRRAPSFQWSPADDRCRECTLRLVYGSDQWRLAGRISSLPS